MFQRWEMGRGFSLSGCVPQKLFDSLVKSRYSWADVVVMVSQGFCGTEENVTLAMPGKTIMSDRQAKKEAYSIVQQWVQDRMSRGKSTTLPQMLHEPSSHSIHTKHGAS